MTNSEDPDRTPQSAASDLVMHCLLMSVCPNATVNMVHVKMHGRFCQWSVSKLSLLSRINIYFK